MAVATRRTQVLQERVFVSLHRHQDCY